MGDPEPGRDRGLYDASGHRTGCLRERQPAGVDLDPTQELARWRDADPGAVGRDTQASTVRIDAGTLGLDATLALEDERAFTWSHGLPLDTEFAEHEVKAIAGSHEVTATLLVEKAPLKLVLRHPERVVVGQEFQLSVRVVDPLPGPVPPLGVNLTGDLIGGSETMDGRGRFVFQAPSSSGTLMGTVHVTGDELRRDALATYTIRVVPEARPLEAGFEPSGPEGHAIFTSGTWLSLGGVLLIIVLGALVGRAVSRPRRGRNAGAGSRSGARDAIHMVPRGAFLSLVALFVMLHAWCVRVRLLPPSATARDLMRRFGAPPVLAQSVTEFERVRYGGEREDPERSRRLNLGLGKGWRRLLRQKGR
jgi:hypothetical protein